MATIGDALRGPIVAVLNTGSGSCDASSADVAKAVFDGAGLGHAQVVTVDPSGLAEALDAAIATASVLVVLGGDGTIGTAAKRCGAGGPLLIPLPGGTMNMLPKALYQAMPWADALAATLANPVVRPVSGGAIDAHRFFCAAILGAPSLWADAREAVRAGHLIEAAHNAAIATQRSLSDAVQYRFGTIAGSAEAVVLICPLVSAALGNDEPALEAVALHPASVSGLMGLAFHAAYDGWRNDPSVKAVRAVDIVVEGDGVLPAILDGEKVDVGGRAAVTFLPVAFRAIVPAQ